MAVYIVNNFVGKIEIFLNLAAKIIIGSLGLIEIKQTIILIC